MESCLHPSQFNFCSSSCFCHAFSFVFLFISGHLDLPTQNKKLSTISRNTHFYTFISESTTPELYARVQAPTVLQMELFSEPSANTNSASFYSYDRNLA